MAAALPVLPLVAVALVLVVFGAMAARRPVLMRMGARNALRRKAQTIVVVGGLMVGTAIISGSLASGDSLANGIRQGAYDGLGPADVFVQLEGQLHFPRELYDDLAADPEVRAATRGLSPLLYEEAALSNPQARQSEPQVSLIGFDPEANRPFGTFTTTGGATVDGTDLGPGDVYLHEELAAKLQARAGDRVTLHYAEPPAPRVPRLFQFDGRLTASAGACPAPGTPACAFLPQTTEPATYAVPVEPGAVAITTIVAWPPQAAPVDLDQVLRAPDGRAFANTNGTPAEPDSPSLLNVTPPLATGEWTLEVGAKAAVDQPFRALALVFYEEYNLSALQAFARDAEEAGFAPEDVQRLTGTSGETQLQSANLTVRHVVRAEGFGDFLLGRNAFARLDTVERLYGQEGKLNMVLASGDADPRAGVERTAELLTVLPRAVNASADAHPELPALRQAKVVPVKERWLEAADRAGTTFKEFLTTIGSFTVLAGIMLIVNIFVMLAEERKSELGMARAVGLKRGQLVQLFAFEGLLYAIVASILGVALGLLLAYGLIAGINELLTSGDDPNSLLSFPFHVEPSSIVYAFAAGFLLTLATILVASWKVSRLNIVRAIRRIEDPPRKASLASLLAGIALAAAGLAGTLYGFLQDQFVLQVLAPCALLVGLGMVASRFAPSRYAYPVTGAAVTAYASWSFFNLGNPDGLVNRVMGPVRGVLIVLAVVLIVVYIPAIVRGTRALLLKARPLVAAATPGIAYPMEKRTRTGLTITMFALVILVVTAFSIFTSTFAIDVQAQSGGYDVDADTTVPLGDLAAWYREHGPRGEPDPFRFIERYDELRYATVFGGELIRIEGQRVNYQGPPVDYLYGFDEEFARNNRFELESRLPEYATDEEAYLAVQRNPSLVIVSTLYSFDEAGQPGAYRVGDTLTLETATGTASFTIAGFQKQIYLGGVFLAPEVLDANFQRIRGEYLIDLREGTDPEAAALEIEAAFEEAGMNAVSIREEAARLLEQNRRFLTLFELFLGFGLVVGIASLGIVTARAVIERRQEIGMLRAIGYPSREILKIFYIEILFTTLLGIVIGVAIGVYVSYGVFASTDALEALGVTFRVPWGDILRFVALTLVFVVGATYWPARAASRIPPAEAVRYVE